MFSCEFCEIYNDNFFKEHQRATASIFLPPPPPSPSCFEITEFHFSCKTPIHLPLAFNTMIKKHWYIDFLLNLFIIYSQVWQTICLLKLDYFFLSFKSLNNSKISFILKPSVFFTEDPHNVFILLHVFTSPSKIELSKEENQCREISLFACSENRW